MLIAALRCFRRLLLGAAGNDRFALALALPRIESGGTAANDCQRHERPENRLVVFLEETKYLFAVGGSQESQRAIANGAGQAHSQEKPVPGILQRPGGDQKWRKGYGRWKQGGNEQAPEAIFFKCTPDFFSLLPGKFFC